MALVFKKPDSKPSRVLPGTTHENWTNRKELISPGLMIGYRSREIDTPGPNGTIKKLEVKYPSENARSKLLGAAAAARTIMRKTVWEIDQVVMFRRKEGQAFTNIMNYHFGLAAGRPGGLPSSNVVDKSFAMKDLGSTDRRWALNKIRQGMLSISFHLNTGMYLIDIDNQFRDRKSGIVGNTSNANEEGYCTWASMGGLHKGVLSGWKNGEIHVGFTALEAYAYNAYARVIIHEAAHKYLGVTDKKYAHEVADYAALSFSDCIDNADSYAWAALSLEAGHLIIGRDSSDTTAHAGNIA